MAKWKIRPATKRDAVPLATCIDAAYAGYRKRIEDLPPVSEGIAGDIEANLVWVAELDRSVVGGLILVVRDAYALLANIAVDPDCSGMGIGRGLVEQAEAQCRTLKKAELRLSTHVAIPENIRLYEHLGWKETGRSANKVHMTKLL
ncbi:MAG: GNAT family N-acetyltransferase [Geminicoccaceae bacterium]